MEATRRQKQLVLILAREFAQQLVTPVFISDDEGRLVFYNESAEELLGRTFAEAGVQLLKVSVGDRAIGYLYNFRLGTRVYAYQSGFADADRRERPGIVTHALAIRHAFRSGAGVYDLMAGPNRLKESLATRCEPMWWQTFQQPRLAFRLEHLGRRLKHALDRQKPLSAAQQEYRENHPSRPAKG